MGADYLEKLGRNPTDAEVKKLISDKLASLDVRFLVLIDDLDRLEPQQAVEVIRMVRSVADFPKVAYVMCYDRSVLAHALERGLHVKDGDLFLQKVVQLTFTIPLPSRSIYGSRFEARSLLSIGGPRQGSGRGRARRDQPRYRSGRWELEDPARSSWSSTPSSLPIAAWLTISIFQTSAGSAC
ncbi:KAP family P-loop NTPase fold protein [Sinorhizobium meliloti]|uniref:KAP family P-loop NTPase fold protein n=1 Tax=Rhizobium meliloti TaxID=382 RepID=UPI0023804168|nr:P-loop NTPase fold protein [Sinorhizobium meliloti]